MTQPGLPGVKLGASAKVRQRSGDDGERVAEHMHARCAGLGIALVRKVQSNVRAGRGGRIVFTGKSTVDCWGVMRDGRAVAVEVKSCQDRRLALSRLESHQLAELAQVRRLGGLALVLVIGPPGEAWAVPYEAVLAEIEKGERQSLGPEQLAPWRCHPVRPYLERFLTPAPAPAGFLGPGPVCDVLSGLRSLWSRADNDTDRATLQAAGELLKARAA